MLKKTFLLLFISAFIAGISFPGNSLGLLALVSYIPLYYVLISDITKPKAFLYGMIWAFIYSTVSMYWIAFSSPDGFLGATFTICLRYGLTLLLFKSIVRNKKWSFLIIPLQIVQDYAATLTDLDYAWYLSGYSLTDYPILLQISEYTGIYGVNFFIYLINYLLLILIVNWHDPRLKKVYFYSIVSIMSMFLLVNILIKSQYNNSELSAIKVGIVQPNIDPFLKWDETYRHVSMDRLLTGTYKALSQKADLIIWPETALPFAFKNSPNSQTQLREISNQSKAILVIGSLDYDYVNTNWVDYNAAFHLLPNDIKQYTYRKRKLVPVIEKSIYPALLGFINSLPGAGSFAMGDSALVINGSLVNYPTVNLSNSVYKTDTLNFRYDSLKFATSICIESNFPEIYRENRLKGAKIVTIITNDGWFYPHFEWFKAIANEYGFSPYFKGKGAYQHNAIARLRAIENRITILRAANTGVSSIIDPFGYSIEEKDQYEEALIVNYAPYLKSDEMTFYTKFGDVFVIFCAVIFLVSCFWGLRKE